MKRWPLREIFVLVDHSYLPTEQLEDFQSGEVGSLDAVYWTV